MIVGNFITPLLTVDRNTRQNQQRNRSLEQHYKPNRLN